MSEFGEVDRDILSYWAGVAAQDPGREGRRLHEKLSELVREGCLTPHLCAVMLVLAIGAIGVVANSVEPEDRQRMFSDLGRMLSQYQAQAQMGTLTGILVDDEGTMQ